MGSADTPAGDGQARPGRSRRPWDERLGSLLNLVVLPLTALTTAFGVAYLVAPSLKPREVLGVSITHMAVEQGIDYTTYVARTPGRTLDGSDPFRLAPKGVAVYVQADIAGFKDRSYSVTVHLLGARDHIEVSAYQTDPSFTGKDGVSSCDNESPNAPQDKVSFTCWSLAPRTGAEFLVRAELYDQGPKKELRPGKVERQTLLDFKESGTFRSVDVIPGHA
jgi:hypothetical protein